MADVGGSPDAGRNDNHSRLLGGHRDTAGPALRSRQVAFAIRAEAAEVTEGQVKRFVPGEKFLVPGPQGGEGRKWSRAHLLVPPFLVDGANRDADIPELCEIGFDLLDPEMDFLSAHHRRHPLDSSIH